MVSKLNVPSRVGVARVGHGESRATCQAPPSGLPFTHPKVTGTVWLAGTACTIALLASPVPVVDAADLGKGQTVFNNSCATCHTGGYNTLESEKTLRKAAMEQYLDGGFSIKSIVYQVENGKDAMPAWAGILSEDEIQAVAAYVYDQASGDKW